jgi:hypothetical protein
MCLILVFELCIVMPNKFNYFGVEFHQQSLISTSLLFKMHHGFDLNQGFR